MHVRPLAAGGLGATLLAGLVLFAVPASAHAGVSRSAAAKAALKALDVRGDARPVRVFGTRGAVARGTRITESAPAGRASIDRRTGVETASPAAVMRTPAEPVWLFYADRGAHQGYEHPGRIALVGARTGKVRLSRTLSWVPVVDGLLPEFFRSAEGYEGNRFVVFDRARPSASASRASLLAAADTEAQRRAAAALAAQHACVLRFSDTLGDFFDFGRVDWTRARVGQLFKRLSALDPGFVTERYVASDGRTPIEAAQRLIDRAGCRDLMLYAAGGAEREGSGGVVIGVRVADGSVQWQTLDASDVRGLVRANRDVSFKLVFDAPYSGRLADVLRDEANVAVLLTSGSADEPSFSYVPALIGPRGIVRNPGNPQHLLEFSNGLIGGLARFTAAPAEVDHGIAQSSTSLLGWMLARGVDLAGPPFGDLTTPIQHIPAATPPATPPAPPVTLPQPSRRPDHAPRGRVTSLATDEDTPVSFTLDGEDDDGDPLTFAVTLAPAHGTVTGAGPRVTYTPAADYSGPDQFSYRVSDGDHLSTPATVSLTIRPVDDAPIVTPSTGRASYTENGAPVAVDPGLALRDVDSSTVHAARVAVADGFHGGHDALAFTDANGIAGAWDAGAGVLTLSGAATVADYQAALRSVTFSTSGDDPSAAVRKISFRADDGEAAHHLGGETTRELAVVAVNDHATLSTSSTGDAAYTEDGAHATVDPALSISDPDSATLAGATVSIGAGHEADDRLELTDPNGIAGGYDSASGKLTLSGAAPLADYEAALRSVEYHTVSDDPSETTREISFQVDDGGATDSLSDDLARGMTVTRHADAPALTAGAGHAAYTERGAAVPVDAALTVTDGDSAQLQSASVRIKDGYDDANDHLSLAGTATISGAFDAASGTLTLTGADSVANYQAALRAVRFSSDSHDPAATRTVELKATDSGGHESAVATQTIDVTPVNDAPVLDAGTGAASFTEGDAPGPAAAPALTLSDADSAAMTGATVEITTNRAAGTDVLAFTDTAEISGSFDAASGVLGLTGSATKAQYQAALRSVSFRVTGDDPSSATRTLSFTVEDGTDTSAASTRGVTVTPVNDAPAVTTSTGSASWSEGGAATQVDGDLTISDPDSGTLATAEVEISPGTVQTGDALAFTPSGDVTGSYDATTHVLSLTGADTVGAYRTVLRSVTFANSTATPGAATRHILFRVDDGAAAHHLSADAERQLAVTEANSAPVVGLSATATSFVEDAGAVAVDPTTTVSDGDSPALAGATVKIQSNFDSAHDTLTYSPPAGNPVTGGTFDAATGTLTLSGSGSAAEYQAALRAVKFANEDQDPSTATRTVRLVVDDGAFVHNLSDAADKDVTVQAVNDAPALHAGAGTSTFIEDQGTATAIDIGITVGDPDDATLSGATVAITGNHAAGQDVLEFTDTTGIQATFDAAAGVLTLTGGDTVANYQEALRSVRYANTSQAPSTATRTITFAATDGGATSTGSGRTKDVQVVAINDAPVLGASGTVTFTENGTATPAAADAVAIAPGLTAADVDSATLAGATVRIAGNHASGEDVLSFANTASITGTFDAASGTLALTGTDTVANYETALRAVKYRDTSNAPSTSARTIRFTADDGAGAHNASDSVDRTVNVVATNDAPVPAGQTFDNAKRAVGNTSLVVDDPSDGAPTPTGPRKTVAADVLAAATDSDGPGPLSVVAASGQATTKGGTVDVEADGDFTYHPPKGYSGTDTFSYGVDDGGTGSHVGAGTVTIDVQDVVWYVDASAGAPPAGTAGRSDTPLNSLAGVSGAGAGDRIFLYPGTYGGGLALKNAQQLLSKRHGLVVPSGSGAGTVMLESAAPGGAGSTVNGGLMLASGNTIQGVDLGATGSPAVFALSGSSVGTATINTQTSGGINNPNGGAVSIGGSGNTLNAALTQVSSTGSSSTGIAIAGATGTFSAQGGTIANATATDVSLSGGSLDFTLGAGISDSSGQLVNITGQSGGVKDFNGDVSGGGISLSGNTGATIRFDGALRLTTGASDAFTATGGGTVAVSNPSTHNVIDSTTGRALNVANTTIHADGLKFERISSNGAPQGIVLSNTGTSGSLTVTGNGGTCTEASTSGCSGGEIQNGTTGGDDSGATPAGTGIVLNDTRAPSLTRMYLHDFANYAIRGTGVNGFTFDTGVINGVNGSTSSVPYSEGAIRFTNLTGSGSIASSWIRGGYTDNLNVVNDSGVLNRLTVSNSTFGSNGAGGNTSMLMESVLGSGAVMNVTVDGSTFSSSRGALVDISDQANGASDLVFTGNHLSNANAGQATGAASVVFHGARVGTMSMNVQGNSFRDARSHAIQITKSEGGGRLSGTVAANTIGVSGVANSGSLEGNGISIDHGGGAGELSLSVTGNQIRQFNNNGIGVVGGIGNPNGTGRISLAVSGNTVAERGTNPNFANGPFQGMRFDIGVDPTDAFQTCLDIGPNAVAGTAGATNQRDVRVLQNFNTTIRLIGPNGPYSGAADDIAGVGTWLQNAVGGGATASAYADKANVGSGGGFLAGTSCP